MIFLHRPASANDVNIDARDKPYFEEFAARNTVYICIAIAKQRQGAIGRACVVFDPAYMQYVEIDRSEPQ